MPAISNLEVQEQFASIGPGLLQTGLLTSGVVLQFREATVRVPRPIFAFDHVAVVKSLDSSPSPGPVRDMPADLAAFSVRRLREESSLDVEDLNNAVSPSRRQVPGLAETGQAGEENQDEPAHH